MAALYNSFYCYKFFYNKSLKAAHHKREAEAVVMETHKTQTILIISMIIGMLLLITACGNSEKTTEKPKEPIVIGALFPLTGGLATYGEAALKSAEIAMDEINAAGGIDGRKLKIDYQDHECNPKTAVSLFEELTEGKGIRVFSTVACSGTVLAIAPKLEEKNALLLGTIVTTTRITGVSPYVFRNWASDNKEAQLFATAVMGRGYKKIGVIYEETEYAEGLKNALEQYLTGNDVEIVSESFASGSADMRSQLTKLQAEEVDMLFISPQTVISADIILKQMEELRFKPNALFVNDNIVKATNIVARYANLLEGAVSGDYILPKTDQLDAFLQRYKRRYGEECPQVNICAGEYDAIKLLAKAISTNGENTEKIREYLKEATYNGISGVIRFDVNNDRDNAHYSLLVIRDGKAVSVS